MKRRCWEFLECDQKECPVYGKNELRCWLIPGTLCRNEIQGEFLEKIEICVECEHFTDNSDIPSMREALRVANEQVREFREMVEERDRELESLSMEMAIGLSEVFEALKDIYSGDPSVRIPETSKLELISKLKHMVNLTAENLSEVIDLSHEFAIGLAEHFDVLHRVSTGELTARVSSSSQLELLESLKKVTNQMIESVSREITERMRAEEALRTSEKKYRSLFDSGPDPIFVLDRETFEILDANASAEETYGYSREEIIGKSFIDLGLFEDDKTGLSFFSTNTQGNSHLVYSKLRHYRKDGKPFYVNVHACQIEYAEREAAIVAITNITEMVEKDALLIQASKMTTLGEMSAGIAHELNQPLNAIKMGNEYLKVLIEQGKKILEQDLFQVVDEVSNQVDRAADIINRLREFGRKADLKKEKVDVNKAIKGALSIIGRQLSLQNIEVILGLDGTLSSIWAHNNRLEQVIFNFITNAKEAIDQKKAAGQGAGKAVITVRSFKEGDRLAVTVSDTGIGIPEDAKSKIFEPFFTTKEVGKGMGLGLSIIYGIVKDYGGDIHMESQEGIGTTFKITFPAAL